MAYIMSPRLKKWGLRVPHQIVPMPTLEVQTVAI